jgi:hypothetical protein
MKIRTFAASWMILGLFAVALCQYAMAAKHSQSSTPSTPAKPMPSDPVTLEGKVQRVISPVQIEMTVETATGSRTHGKWTISTQPSTKLAVTGETTRDFLRTGLLVQFLGEVGAKGQLKDPVDELTVVMSARKLAEDETTANPDDKDQDTTPAASDSQGPKLTGFLRPGHGNAWTVHMDNRDVQLKLTDDVKITVLLADGRHISPGDKISVQGKMYHGKPGACLADDVKVTLAKPLAAPKKATKSAKPSVKPILPGEESKYGKE